MEMINFYQYEVCGQIFKTTGDSTDWFRAALFTGGLAWLNGNLEAVNLWHKKALAAWLQVDLAATRKYKEENAEVHVALMTPCPVLILLGQYSKVQKTRLP